MISIVNLSYSVSQAYLPVILRLWVKSRQLSLTPCPDSFRWSFEGMKRNRLCFMCQQDNYIQPKYYGVAYLLGTPVPQKCSFQVNVLDGAWETLVLLGVIVLQTNLDLDSLQKVTFFVLRWLEDCIHTLVERVTRYLRPKADKCIVTKSTWTTNYRLYHWVGIKSIYDYVCNRIFFVLWFRD